MKVRNIVAEKIPRGRGEAINKTYGETATEREGKASWKKNMPQPTFVFPEKEGENRKWAYYTQQRIFVPLLLLLLCCLSERLSLEEFGREMQERERERERERLTKNGDLTSLLDPAFFLAFLSPNFVLGRV